MPRILSQIVSTVPTGTSPLSVASTTLVANLNAQFLQGYTPSSFAAASHTHIIADTTGLQAALDAKLATSGGTITGTLALSGIGSDVSSAGSWRLLVRDPSTNAVRPMTAAYARGHLDAAAASHTHIIADTTGLQAALDAKIAATRQVATQHSLTGGGSLALDRTLSLVNDSASPGNSKYYGTDSGGTKGFHSLPSASGDSRACTYTSSDHTFSSSGGIVIVNATSGSKTVTLPLAPSNGILFTVARDDANGAVSVSVVHNSITIESLDTPDETFTWVYSSTSGSYHKIAQIA